MNLRHLALSIALVVVAAAPLPAQAPQPAAPEPAATGGAAAAGLAGETPGKVVVWGREIVVLRTSYAGKSPVQRAREVEERIELTLAANPQAPIHFQGAAVGNLRGMLILAGPDVLLGILEGDLPPGGTLQSAALAAAGRLRELAAAMQRQGDAGVQARGIGKSVAAVAALLLLAWLLERRLRPYLLARSSAVANQAARERATAGKGPGRLDLTFLKATAVRTSLRSGLLLVELVAAFLCAQYVLLQFPYTEPLGNQLARRLLAFATDVATNVADALPNVFVIAVIAFTARAVWSFVKRWTIAVEANLLESSWLDADTARPTRILLGIGIGAIAIVVAYPFIPGSSSDAFKGVSVLIGVMVSLGGSSVIGQMIAGLVVLYSGAVKRGDFVCVGDHEGHVADIGLLATRLSTAYAEQVNIPSSVMVSAISRNSMRFAAPGGTTLRTTLAVGYDTPWRLVHGLLLEAAQRTPGVLPSPPARVFQRALSTFFVEYVLFLQFDRNLSRVDVSTTLHATILDTFNAHGVQIMVPAFEGQPDRRILVPREEWTPVGSVAGVAPAPPVAAAPRSEEGGEGSEG
ncbi:MAG TPA: mechanosensitive ion channel domain-containing protein [Thermoanaerobaculia bacterium]|nr:mechanosensitive ion channel domain-containing protein [Thermoanaerobaculia bacterium]